MVSVSIFNVARYLTDSLRGPVLAHYDEAEGRVWVSKSLELFKNLQGFSNFFLPQNVLFDGTDGTDGDQKCPLIFFILRYIKHYTHIYLYIYIKKLSRQISCGFKTLDKLGVRIKKFKNTLLVGFFLNQSKSRKKVKGFPCKINPRSNLKGILL